MYVCHDLCVELVLYFARRTSLGECWPIFCDTRPPHGAIILVICTCIAVTWRYLVAVKCLVLGIHANARKTLKPINFVFGCVLAGACHSHSTILLWNAFKTVTILLQACLCLCTLRGTFLFPPARLPHVSLMCPSMCPRPVCPCLANFGRFDFGPRLAESGPMLAFWPESDQTRRGSDKNRTPFEHVRQTPHHYTREGSSPRTPSSHAVKRKGSAGRLEGHIPCAWDA